MDIIQDVYMVQYVEIEEHAEAIHRQMHAIKDPEQLEDLHERLVAALRDCAQLRRYLAGTGDGGGHVLSAGNGNNGGTGDRLAGNGDNGGTGAPLAGTGDNGGSSTLVAGNGQGGGTGSPSANGDGGGTGLSLAGNGDNGGSSIASDRSSQASTDGEIGTDRILEELGMDVFEFSFSVKLDTGEIAGAVCLTNPDIDASQFVGRLVDVPVGRASKTDH